MFKWLKKQNTIAKKLAGLDEKEKSTQHKIELADKLSRMFDRRSVDTPVEPGFERRKEINNRRLAC